MSSALNKVNKGFNKVLVANRGEIAVRVIRSAQSLGYRTVAVFSEADANAPHVSIADEAICIGAAAVGESYLVAEKLIAAAKKTGADAIHPGYGFLSENSAFAKACIDANIVFIGPRPEAIDLMGSKRHSKIAMIAAGVPCIPGYEGADQDDDVLKNAAIDIGMPVMLKASAGGGGRGMRLVTDANDLDELIKSARSEALNAFGSGELIIEKAVMQPRHIEIQVFADSYGNTVYLGERDCSVQRRHQKVVEEAPSPFVNPAMRKAMGEAAVNAAKSCNYVGAGTVEFLADSEGNFYFLEMNTRLQVEHPVTELITGLDLVAMQLRVAAGDKLSISQEDVTLTGHAMEVRLYAEDPGANFIPQTGLLNLWQPATGDGIRIDSGIQQGQAVSPFYDPMLAKIIAYGENREEARRRLVLAVEDSKLLGIKDNRAFLASILRDETFIQGEATTAFIAEDFSQDPSLQPLKAKETEVALAASILCALSSNVGSDLSSSLRAGTGWQNNRTGSRVIKLSCEDQVFELALSTVENTITVDFASTELASTNTAEEQDLKTTQTIKIIEQSENTLKYLHDDIVRSITYSQTKGTGEVLGCDQVHLAASYGNLTFTDISLQSAKKNKGGSDQVLASMDGGMVDVMVQVGDVVKVGQTLAVLEAMKMEHPLKAGIAGTIAEVLVQAGDQVKGRQKLIQILATETEG
ncbi:MAG: acetyl/propionyl/methylcrotonyl-CoA carboxylase subunit alpha [Oleispira sp.]|nr:acetyl/propionyl/methylcrotonyl-CoA carboxylase subunit alpha [Oleispira sp.]